MATRRVFLNCALCAITGLIATRVDAQTPAATAGVTRKILQQVEGPTPGYITVIVEAEIAAGATVARHTHPGIESSYVLSGGGELIVDGEANRTLKPGDAFQIPVARPHSLVCGATSMKVAGSYIVEKGKPLASPA
jgi:quercetin dioxygenase-like cupin family protein